MADEAYPPWSTPVLAKVITAFTDPGAQVVVLTWPRPECHGPSADRAVPVEPDRLLVAALHVAQDLGRTAHLIHSTPPGGLTSPSRLQHADRADDRPCDADTATAPGAHLVITSVGPEYADDRTCEHIATAAAAQLRTGGILAVLTHTDWSGGRLVDPTGPIVAAAQNADLLYLQHIVLIHAPVQDGHFALNPRDPTETNGRTLPPTPLAHRRIHTDLLAFAQPRDHNPLPLSPTAIAGSAAGTG